MTTIDEVAEWCRGAAALFGDPAIPVAQIFVRYEEDLGDYRGGDLAFAVDEDSEGSSESSLILRLWPPDQPHLWTECGAVLTVAMEGPRFAGGQLSTFGVRPVSPGVWYLTPSLNVPGKIHAFVVLYHVPIPAPWEPINPARRGRG